MRHISGYYLKDLIIIQASTYNFNPAPYGDIVTDQDYFNDIYKVMPTIFSLIGLILVYLIYTYYPAKSQYYYRQNILLSYLSSKKFFADAFNSYYVFLPTANFSLKITYKLIDQGILEYLGPNTHDIIEKILKNLKNIEATLLIYRSLLFLIFSLGTLMAIILGLNIIIVVLFFIISLVFRP